ncbi:MAG: nitroreductase family protein, partial [Planctomycetes bacterium]|nr:nitroreductase family protein [Planctomycetota bacterium]
MDIFDAIAKRHSYRGEFESEAVPRKDLEKILQAGINAPSGCNAQSTSFVAVDDPELLAKFAGVMDKPFVKTAQAIIVCIIDPKPVYGDFEFSAEDCAASVE